MRTARNPRPIPLRDQTERMLSDEFETVLLSSGYFSTTLTPEMAEREAALARAVPMIEEWIAPVDASVGEEQLAMRVKAGGRQSNFAPVPWIRVFDPAHSPRTTEGFYLVYLFAGDGSAIYLSLNQGTSEFRSGKM